MEWEDRRSFNNGVVFEPNENIPGAFNLWRGFAVRPKKGSWELMKKHLLLNVCQGNANYYEWLMTWMAQIFQQPQIKLGSAVVIKGKKGTGKSIVGEWLTKAIGSAHSMKVAQRSQLLGNFNAHQMGKILIVCEEAFWAGDPQSNGVLKHLITADTMMAEKKGMDVIEVSNRCRLLMISNEAWVVPAGMEDERRFFVLECGEAQKQNTDYFEAIHNQMSNCGVEAMVYELMNFEPVKGWSTLRNPPKTEALMGQAMEGMDTLHKFFHRFVIMGTIRDDAANMGQEDITLYDGEESLVNYAALQWHAEKFVRANRGRSRPDGHFRSDCEEVLLAFKNMEKKARQDRTIDLFMRFPPREKIIEHMQKKGFVFPTIEDVK
jgi:hypothetical protein